MGVLSRRGDPQLQRPRQPGSSVSPAKVGRTCRHGLRRHPLRPSRKKTLYVGITTRREWECLIGHPSVRVADDGTLTGTVSDGGPGIYVPTRSERDLWVSSTRTKARSQCALAAHRSGGA